MGSSRLSLLWLGLSAFVSRPTSRRGGGRDGQAAFSGPHRHLGVDGPERGHDLDPRRRLARAPGLRPRRQRALRRQQDVAGQGGAARDAGGLRWGRVLAGPLPPERAGADLRRRRPVQPDGAGGQRLRRRAAAASPSATTRPTTTSAATARAACAARTPTTTPPTSFTTARPAACRASPPRRASGWPPTCWCPFPRRPATCASWRAGSTTRRTSPTTRSCAPRAPRPSAAPSTPSATGWSTTPAAAARRAACSTATTGSAAARTTSSSSPTGSR